MALCILALEFNNRSSQIICNPRILNRVIVVLGFFIFEIEVVRLSPNWAAEIYTAKRLERLAGQSRQPARGALARQTQLHFELGRFSQELCSSPLIRLNGYT